jgi:hypothetical protein
MRASLGLGAKREKKRKAASRTGFRHAADDPNLPQSPLRILAPVPPPGRES